MRIFVQRGISVGVEGASVGDDDLVCMRVYFQTVELDQRKTSGGGCQDRVTSDRPLRR